MSAILSADDLNDFISPGVACIKPVETKKTIDPSHARIEISMDGVPTETLESGQSTTLEKAQISLSDCLACSGCITSAESVLVSLQSHEELLSSLKNSADKIFVASISHQVRVSLAAAYGISVAQVDAKLQNLLVDTLGFKYVVGLEVGRVISLAESFREVSTKSIGKPVLCSSCPGWTCYAEKTHPHIIPYLSHVKSPQQITGTLIKDLIHKETGVSKDKVYHLSIMPCFDKKLEAARPEFGQETDSVPEYRDVDCVITAKEIVLLLMNEGMSFESLKDTRESVAPSPVLWPANEQWLSHMGSSSGGYLDYILAAVQGRISKPTQIQIINGKNADVVELRVVSEDNEVHFRAARIYGFRNIQNLVRKLKPTGKKPGGNAAVRAKVTARATARGAGRRRAAAEESGESLSDPSQLDYVEVMACPGGCLNGGGQIGVPEDKNQKEWKQQLEDLYQNMPQIDASNWADFIEQKASDWTTKLSIDSTQLSVEYHAIDDILNPSSQSPAAAVAATPLALGAKW
ncbi:uncharacterized protein SAPINGB_P005547 [Magnusiomyces paraingens]|uniref:Cytosolic Fe-S cluster assembly factor NAR1 n=1 Tax=Magnusiomyces paraingens TaxID=2606893 RepID=A0A5E8C7E6_9ASCO|nr:uncharacterized protein SAPINGB_P005547 [Saprochaete ingens]VVT57126.1 unnamed protein product [Saprochaete ingens]